MMGALRQTDEQLLRQLHAPPDLHDGVESLTYWQRRSRRLPWYRIRARREAVRMTALWERRVGAAVFSQRHASLESRVAAGSLVARTRLARWGRRGAVAVMATMTTVVVLVTIVTVAVLAALVHAL